MRRFITLFLVSICSLVAGAQDFELKSTVEIYSQLQQLQRGVRVLYVAAHPDDENTRLIAWLENDQHMQTAYLSLTRGQGGQNLIGDEKGDGLGVIRTFELLEARKIDGGEQYFTRAVDFGYSKSAVESFEFWGQEAVLHDVVKVIRTFRPHVIITRFPPDRNAGHGHHEASALLAEEAFDLAADPNAYAEQLTTLTTWQPTVLYHNASSWWDKTLDERTVDELLAQKIHRVDVGTYSDILGLGMNEIAALARSKHRCQAFGTPRSRGEQWEYLRFVKGEWSETLFSDIAGVWSQSEEHANGLQRMIDDFNFTDREANLSTFNSHVLPLLSQRSMWAEATDMQKVFAEVNGLKMALSGIRVECFADEMPIVAGSSFQMNIEVYNLGSSDREVTVKLPSKDTIVTVPAGKELKWKSQMLAPIDPSVPYWLARQKQGWLYGETDQQFTGAPNNLPLSIPYLIKMDGQWVMGESPLHRRWNDRSFGEIVQPFAVVPAITITPGISAKAVQNGETVRIPLIIKAFDDIENMVLDISSLPGLQVIAKECPSSMLKGQTRSAWIDVAINSLSAASEVQPFIAANGQRFNISQSIVRYEHIPETYIHSTAQVRFIPMQLSMNAGKRILYIEGSGDEVDETLEGLGYNVTRTTTVNYTLEELKQFDAIITGIRAFNQNTDLAVNMDLLQGYVMGGGKLLIQYNTTYDLKLEQIGPYDLELGRDRVTDESSAAQILQPKHPAMNQPNVLTNSDFDGWVQERGLYFAKSWDKQYTPLVGWSDPGENQLEGGLLVASYGKGKIIYTGISFFRQLPAGVPGAIRLMVNLIEY